MRRIGIAAPAASPTYRPRSVANIADPARHVSKKLRALGSRSSATVHLILTSKTPFPLPYKRLTTPPKNRNGDVKRSFAFGVGD